MSTAERPLRKDAERNRRLILEAAEDLFRQRGLGATLNDIAHHAGVGVGTVYRRFPDKELLIDALFEERVAELIDLAEAALADPDPWDGLAGFLRACLELQARDRALKELLLSTDEGCARVAGARDRLLPLSAEIVDRARRAGVLLPGMEAADLPAIQWMIGSLFDLGPDLWRRLLEIVLRGMRADAGPAEPLPAAALTDAELGGALACRPSAR
jgi:AcrR family transcriptional regulator